MDLHLHDGQTEKNKYIMGLRDHLMQLYHTEHQYTYGESDLEIEIGRSHSHTVFSCRSKNQNRFQDLRGFCFRKDLCTIYLLSEEKVVNDVNEYSKRNGFETIRNEDKLEIDISGKKYWLQASIGEGSADSISLYFHECLFQ